MPVCGAWFGPWFIFPIIGLALMVVMLVFGPRGRFASLVRRGDWGAPSGAGPSGGERPPDILMRRYAAGEITREQFEQMRRDLA